MKILFGVVIFLGLIGTMRAQEHQFCYNTRFERGTGCVCILGDTPGSCSCWTEGSPPNQGCVEPPYPCDPFSNLCEYGTGPQAKAWNSMVEKSRSPITVYLPAKCYSSELQKKLQAKADSMHKKISFVHDHEPYVVELKDKIK